MNLLATIDFQSTLTWAVFIAWIMSVVLHELAHGIVAYLGGDYTIRERGGLTLNPIQYIDPVMSLLLPAVFLLMGGIPLPGGVGWPMTGAIVRYLSPWFHPWQHDNHVAMQAWLDANAARLRPVRG